ncbi:hypothetical protein, partial [Azotobacter vinelandii]|uniref:hypothetical protein n=1 Tax=Azotobacter vinelandii TaxID=354 RepID=UPI001E4025D8
MKPAAPAWPKGKRPRQESVKPPRRRSFMEKHLLVVVWVCREARENADDARLAVVGGAPASGRRPCRGGRRPVT